MAFPKGHIVNQKDICHLMKLGKRHLYILDLDETKVHEDQAVLELVKVLAGNGVEYNYKPKEGKLELLAAHDGLLARHIGTSVCLTSEVPRQINNSSLILIRPYSLLEITQILALES